MDKNIYFYSLQCSREGVIALTGLAEGADIAVYSTAGQQLGSTTATISTDLTSGSVAIVKIGDNSIKVVVK